MDYLINGIDYHNLEAQRYWSMPASWAPERKKQETRDFIFSGDYIGARKMDGAFYKFCKYNDGSMELLGRSKSVNGDYLNKIEWVPQLQPFFDRLPNGTCLIGEIYFPDKEGSNNVTTIMGCLKEKALSRQEHHKLHYYVFDVLAWNGKHIYKEKIEDRIHNLEYIESMYCEFECVDYAQYFEGIELWDQLQLILANDGEGVVITKKGTSYLPGQRKARQTLKVKKELQETIDVVIMGANAPTRLYSGKEILTWTYWEDVKTGEKLRGELYKDYSDGLTIEPITKAYWNGWAGSLKIGLYSDGKLIQIGSLSGITDEMLENWRDYIGQVIEITGMQIFRDSNGKFSGIRHPKMLRIRSDKNRKDCTMEQLI